MRLTEAQRRYLQFLGTRRTSVAEYEIKPQHLSMLRRMEERGIVRRTINARWAITDAGRRALKGERDG